MQFFSRRTAPADANTSTSVAGSREKHSRHNIMSSTDRRHKRKHSNNAAAYGDGTLNKRPSFGHWVKLTWPDILTMIVMGAIGLGVSRHCSRMCVCKY